MRASKYLSVAVNMVKPSSYRYAKKKPYAKRYRRKYTGYTPRGFVNRVANSGDDKYVRALINPFDSRAIGARIPDANACPSSAIQSIDTYICDSDATYNGQAYLFLPGIQILGAVAGMATKTSWAWTAGYGGSIGGASISTNVQTNFEAFRVVSHGIKITAMQPVTSAQGTLHYCYGPLSTFSASTWAAPTDVSQMQKMNGYTRVPISSLAQKSLILVNKPLDVTSQRYIASNNAGYGSSGTSEFNFPFQHCALFIFMEAVSTSVQTSVLQVEMVQHLEGIVNTNNSSAAFTSSTAQPFNPTALSVGAQISAVTKVAMYEDDPEWDQLAVQAVDAIEGGAAGFAAGMAAGGPVGAALGTVYGGLRGWLGRPKITPKRQFENAVSSTNNKKRLLTY